MIEHRLVFRMASTLADFDAEDTHACVSVFVSEAPDSPGGGREREPSHMAVKNTERNPHYRKKKRAHLQHQTAYLMYTFQDDEKPFLKSDVPASPLCKRKFRFLISASSITVKPSG